MSAVDYAVDGHVPVITINRPEARNAVNAAVAEGIEAAVDRVEAPIGLAGHPHRGVFGVRRRCGPQGGQRRTGGRSQHRARRFRRVRAAGAFRTGHRRSGGPRWPEAPRSALPATSSSPPGDARFGIPGGEALPGRCRGRVVPTAAEDPDERRHGAGLTGDPVDAVRAHSLGLVNHLAEPGDAFGRASGWPSDRGERAAGPAGRRGASCWRRPRRLTRPQHGSLGRRVRRGDRERRPPGGAGGVHREAAGSMEGASSRHVLSSSLHKS